MDSMRGSESKQSSMLCLLSPEERVPPKHPLRPVKMMANAALAELSSVFDEMYSVVGRPSIPPEQLLKASLLMALYTVRSERLFCERLDYDLLFRWFLDMDMVERSFDHSTFSKNRARLLQHDVAARFFQVVVKQAQNLGLMSDEHFTVDGTLIEAWASMKSFRPKDEKPGDRPPPDDPGNPSVDFHGEKRTNETHASTTDPEARLAKKAAGDKARLSYSAHVLMENRNGLIVNFRVAPATGTAERDVAIAMVDEALPGARRITLGADKKYDAREFVERCRERNVTPHLAMNTNRAGGSAIDRRTTRYPGYAVSLRLRKRVEEIFGWVKTVGHFRRSRFRGSDRTQLAAHLVGAAYNLLRIARITTLQVQPA